MKSTTDLLKKLPPSSLAAPVLNAAFRHDDDEISRVIGCVRRDSVLAPALEYMQTRQFLEGRLLLVALEFWRSTAFAANCNAAVLAYDPKRPAREIFELDAEFQAWKRWALILDRLLSQMCSISGIDQEAARQFLSLPPADTETPLDAEERAALDERVSEFKTALSEAGRGL